MKRVLIIGYGSIGKRHADVYKTLGCQVALVSSQKENVFKTYSCLSDALHHFGPEIVLITNETSMHLETLTELKAQNFNGIVLVEKPLFDQVVPLFEHSFKGLYVLYNLRMSPLLLSLKEKLAGEEIVTVNIYCGQYLPSWRAGRDYRETYSAKKEKGGGVIRDLSHELDYATWLAGDFEKISALGGHFSGLEINSDDVFNIVGKCARAPSVNITINYLDRLPKRTVIVNTNNHTFTLDLIKGELWEDDKNLMSGIKASDTYLEQAKNSIQGKFENFCTFEHGNRVLKLIEASELSSKEGRVIEL